MNDPWANIGTAVLIFLVAVNLKIVALYLLATLLSYRVLLPELAVNLIESPWSITETAIDGFETCNKLDLNITLAITNDKREMLRGIRQNQLTANQDLDITLRRSLYSLTLF